MIRILELVAAFFLGATAALVLVDRLMGGHGPRVELDPLAVPWGEA